MDEFVAKVREVRNKLQKERCKYLGVPFIPTPDEDINLFDELNHNLTMEQLKYFGVVSNVRYENGRKVVGW